MVCELYLSKTVIKKNRQAREVGRRNGISSLRGKELHGVSGELRRAGGGRRARVRDVPGLSEDNRCVGWFMQGLGCRGRTCSSGGMRVMI